jgi:1-acyl-sn-glycerol-3-phosphate acyltransferase
MPEARVIPIGGGDRPGRKSSSAADAVAAGASRASGERARRRRATPLLDQASADDQITPAAQPRKRPATKPVANAPAATAPAAAEPTEPAEPPLQEEVAPPTMPEWERKVAAALAFVRRRITGDVEVDEFGFDQELTEHVLLAAFRPLYEHYFRVEARGLENVPTDGGALVVANHSGTIPLDSVMTQIALLDHHPAHRHLRMLGADLVFQTPFISELARKSGTTLACNADAERLLHRGEVVGVWPEGFKGIGKPFAERYKLQRFGRGGFVSAALRAQVPIVPCSIVGAEEIYPIIGNMKTLARLLGLPYVPVTPTFPWLGPLGMVPLPSKWIIEFGEPIPTDGFGLGAADDPMLVFNLTDQVRETIQHTLYRLLMARRSIFF